MARANYEFAAKVLERLREAGYEPVVEPTVGGLTPDLALLMRNGQTAIIEIKSWKPSPDNIERAQAQAVYYKERLGAVEAFVVFPASPSESSRDVVGIDDLVDHLEDLERWRHKGAGSPAPVEAPNPIMFCAMPFDALYDDVFFVAMSEAARQNSLTARRVDQDEFSGDIVARIHELIEDAELVVADMSESRPNVLYEVGYARGIGKTVIQVCATPLDELPFDVAHDNTIEYRPGGTHHLGKVLAARVAATLQ